MMDGEFEVGGHVYRHRPMPAMTQLLVLKRFGPASAAAQAAGNGEAALITVFPHMSDADAEFVIASCLSSVERQIDGGLGWAKVWNPAAKMPAFEDIHVMAMVDIAAEVLTQSFSRFFPGRPSA